MNITQALADLKRTSVSNLRRRFAELYGYETDNYCRVWLIRRIAWGLQASALGQLSDGARARAAELAKKARRGAGGQEPASDRDPLATPGKIVDSDPRLPPPGTILVRYYKERRLEVKVLAKGFEFEGTAFKSISALVKHITGSHWNGYHFFRLRGGDQ